MTLDGNERVLFIDEQVLFVKFLFAITLTICNMARIRMFLVLFICAVVSLFIPEPIRNSSSLNETISIISDLSNNVSAGHVLPPLDFKVDTFVTGDHEYDQESYLFAIIMVLHALAFLERSDPITTPLVFDAQTLPGLLSSCPQITVASSGTALRDLKIHHILWALGESLNDIITEGFFETEIYLYWANYEFATIVIGADRTALKAESKMNQTEPVQPLPVNASHPTQNRYLSSGNVTLPAQGGDGHTSFAIRSNERPIIQLDALVAIIAALISAAGYYLEMEISPMKKLENRFGSVYLASMAKRRNNAPYYHIGNLILALSQIAIHLVVDTHDYVETFMDVYIDGVKVAASVLLSTDQTAPLTVG